MDAPSLQNITMVLFLLCPNLSDHPSLFRLPILYIVFLGFFTAFHFLVETVLAGVSPHYLSIALLFSVIVTPLGFKKAVWSIALHVARGFQGGNQKNGFVVVKKHHPRCILIKL